MSETASNPAFPTNKYPRLTSWWVIALVLSIAVLLLSPGQLPVSLYKLNLIALAAVAGYWIDRSIFPYARPNIDALRLIEPMPDFEVSKAEVDRGMVDTGEDSQAPLLDHLFKARHRLLRVSCAFHGNESLGGRGSQGEETDQDANNELTKPHLNSNESDLAVHHAA